MEIYFAHLIADSASTKIKNFLVLLTHLLYNTFAMIKLFSKYGKNYLIDIILAPIFKIFEAIFGLIVPLIVKNIIDNGINGNYGNSYIIQQGLILLALGIIGFIMTMVCQALSVKVASNYAYCLRNDLYKKINTFSYKEIDVFTPSKLQTVLNSDLIATQNAFIMLLRLAIRAPFIVVGSIIMSMFVDLKLSWIFIICGVLLGLVIFIIGFISIPYNNKVQLNMDIMTKKINDNLTGVRVVRAFNRQKQEKDSFFKITGTIEQISNRLAKISSLSNPLNSMIVNATLILILYLGRINVQLGSLSQGGIVSLVNYMSQISAAIVVVANLIVIFSKGSASANRINQILDSSSSLKVGDKILESNKVKISFKNVYFKYNKDASNSLENINLNFESGKIYGIIGGTGSGKTTLINLLCHFYDVSSGEILLNDINIDKYNEEELYKKIGLVSQNPVLFSGTIEENLTLGNKNASKELIEKSLEIGQAKDVVDAKNGLKGMILQGGKNLSGGQIQRLTITRALVKDPYILILDDASSALDFKTDYLFRKAICNNYKDRLVIFVSQRVSSIKDLDEIVVLDKGNVVGIGKHDDLYNNCNFYKELCLSQNINEVENEKSKC